MHTHAHTHKSRQHPQHTTEHKRVKEKERWRDRGSADKERRIRQVEKGGVSEWGRGRWGISFPCEQNEEEMAILHPGQEQWESSSSVCEWDTERKVNWCVVEEHLHQTLSRRCSRPNRKIVQWMKYAYTDTHTHTRDWHSLASKQSNLVSLNQYSGICCHAHSGIDSNLISKRRARRQEDGKKKKTGRQERREGGEWAGGNEGTVCLLCVEWEMCGILIVLLLQNKH